MKKQKTCNNVIFINFYQDTQCENDKQLLVKINLNLKDKFKKLTEIQFIKLRIIWIFKIENWLKFKDLEFYKIDQH